MPPKIKVTKEMIVKAGYELVREQGIENVNSRAIANQLTCSTQPVFSHFRSMEELRQEVHDYACQCYEKSVLEKQDTSKDIIRESCLQVLMLAQKEPYIFALIYLSRFCQGDNLLEVRLRYQSNQKILLAIQEKYQLSEERSLDVLKRISIFVQGLATIVATSEIGYTEDEWINLVERSLDDFAKKRR